MFGGGQISITSDTEKGAARMLENTVKALVRAEMCTSCGICGKSCHRHAIKIKNGLHIDPELCDSCGRCARSCMVVHYYDRLIAGEKVSRTEQSGKKRVHTDRRRRHVRGYRRRCTGCPGESYRRDISSRPDELFYNATNIVYSETNLW